MSAKRKPKKQNEDLIVEELNAIKRLIILQLITSGVQATDIAAALGVHKSSVSRLVSKRKVKVL
jgi:predicted transcriptional regulator